VIGGLDIQRPEQFYNKTSEREIELDPRDGVGSKRLRY